MRKSPPPASSSPHRRYDSQNKKGKVHLTTTTSKEFEFDIPITRSEYHGRNWVVVFCHFLTHDTKHQSSSCCVTYQNGVQFFFVTARNYLNHNNTRMLRSFRILTLLLFLSTIINSSHGKLGKSASVVDPWC